MKPSSLGFRTWSQPGFHAPAFPPAMPVSGSLGRWGMCLLLLFGLATHSVRSAEHTRPNILWLVSEDNSPLLGCYGEPLARTPNLDQLAQGGIVYEKAYANAPVCAPARSAIITGAYPSSLGTQHMRSYRPLPEGLKFFPEYLRAAGYYCTNNDKTDYNTATEFGPAWDESSAKAHYGNRAAGQPFFAVFNFFSTHESNLHERRPLETDPARVTVPAYLPDNAETRADVAQYHDAIATMDRQVGEVLRELEAAGLAEDTIIFYYGDHGGATPRSKRFLYENGVHVPLIVHVPEKYRSLAPLPAGSRTGELVSFVDLAPTVLSLAGLPIPATMQGRAFAGLARAPAPAFAYQLRDRMDERYDLSRAVTDGRYRYIRNYLPHLPAGQHVGYLWRQASMRRWDELYRSGALNDVQSAFFRERAPEELFDLVNDPDNVRNLAGDPAHRATLERLRAANRDHLLNIRDTGFMPEAMMAAMAGSDSPQRVAGNQETYPLARLLDLIDGAQLAPTPQAEALLASLQDPQPVIRYWACLGTMRAKASAALTAGLIDRLKDDEPTVRLGAAQALLRQGTSTAAWAVIADGLAPANPGELRLAALNVIARQETRPAWLAAKITAPGSGLGRNGENYVSAAADYLIKTSGQAEEP